MSLATRFNPPINLEQLILLRCWTQRMPWVAIANAFRPASSASEVMAEVEGLLEDLIGWAQRAGRNDLAAILAGGPQAHPHWERDAQRAFEAIPRLTLPDPVPTDPLTRWFPERIAAPLRRRDILTLADLSTAATLAGWWRAIPNFGGEAIRQVREFFRDQPALEPLQEAEWLPLAHPPRPAHLLGGEFGAPAAAASRTGMHTDLEAIHGWLKAYEPGSPTFIAYRKEVERFWLWAVVVQQKCLRDLLLVDAQAYREFMANPQPEARWCGGRRHRDSPHWRPFEKAVSKSGILYAEQIIRRFLGWLVDAGYLEANPYRSVRPLRTGQKPNPIPKALTQHEWDTVLDFCEAKILEGGRHAIRYRHGKFALLFGYHTGLRLGNLAAATLGDIERIAPRTGSEGLQWWLCCRVKGNKAHKVALANLLPELQEYLRFRGYTGPIEALDPAIPFIGKQNRSRGEDGYLDEPYTQRGLHDLFSALFKAAGAVYQGSLEVNSERLARARAHTLRHTHATHSLDRGMHLKVVQKNLGHEDLSTTSRYVSDDEDVRYEESQKLRSRRRPPPETSQP